MPAHLDLGRNLSRTKGRGGLRRCYIGAHLLLICYLDLGSNRIGCAVHNKISDVGAWRFVSMLPQCTSLAHLDLRQRSIRTEGKGRPAAVLPQCPRLKLHM